MMLDSIDWSRPWLRSVRTVHASLDTSIDWKEALNHCIAAKNACNELDKPIRFVDQVALPQGISYEAFIHETGQVPTRNNLHDFFNALVWISFPLIKRQLNALQAAQINRNGINAQRGCARDAATVFDENAVLLVVRDAEVGSQLKLGLQNHEWQNVFLFRRPEFIEHCDVWLFGHALMEKLVNPYKAITAHVWPVIGTDEYFRMEDVDKRHWLDREVASQLLQYGDGSLSTSCFTPLPVLGVPGWWSSQDERFYADEQVFRPKRRGG